MSGKDGEGRKWEEEGKWLVVEVLGCRGYGGLA